MSCDTSRFVCPSSSLGLKSLLRRTATGVWAALALTVAVHLSLTQIRAIHGEQRAAKPLTTRFVKRQPRLSKPLELRKRPQPKRRQLRRQMVAVRAQARGGEAASKIQAFALAGGLARPCVSVSRGVGLETAEMEPQAVAQMIEGEKEAKHVLDMSLEMVDVHALDTGRYHALVIQDPTDKRNIRGFFHLKYAYSKSQLKGWLLGNDWRMIHGVTSMIESMNHYTDIKATYEGKILFTSRELLKIPWVFMFHPEIKSLFVFSDEEATCLGRYLMSGGFVLCDVIDPRARIPGRRTQPLNLSCTRNNFRVAMATQGLAYGRDWTFEILPSDHGIFHCYFDFDGAPGGPSDKLHELGGKLEGITVDGRLLLATCQKALIHLWGDPEYPQYRSERMIQFGVNTVIFALTQEGSITHRVVDAVR